MTQAIVHAVVGIIMQDDKVLIAERPLHKPYAGYWEFPGGKVEANENSETALKRELHEELGIEVLTAMHCFNHTRCYDYKTVLLEIWRVKTYLGVPCACENQVLRWIGFAEIGAVKLLEGNRAILDKVRTFGCYP